MLVKTYGSAVTGVDAMLITIEVNLGGAFGYVLVGLPDNAVRESRERVEAAIRNNGFEFPRGKLTLNMAPADVRKEGAAYDLTIAIGILSVSGQIHRPVEELEQYLIMGELSLDGSLRPIKGALPMAIMARKEDFKAILLPAENAQEAGIVVRPDVIPLNSLSEAVEYLNGKRNIAPVRVDTRELFDFDRQHFSADFSDVRGQENVKRSLEVAAAGGHNVIMIGPPGAGKSMLAKRMPSIMPPMTLQEALETTKIHSVAGKIGADQKGLVAQRPFRSPHHTISDVALVGGGVHPQPGEISLAHNGVLFLDELPEFKRTVLEVLRQPIEERKIDIARARFAIVYPANFMLVASMNPCPCGYYNHPTKDCICPAGAVHRYMSRISGPLLDRIDLHIEITPVDFDDLTGARKGETSDQIRKRVTAAREVQRERFAKLPGVHSNAMMESQVIREICLIDKPSENLLKRAMNQLRLSARAYDRILKVSRTIADLSESDRILAEHVAEAIQYRNLDRDGWGA